MIFLKEVTRERPLRFRSLDRRLNGGLSFGAKQPNFKTSSPLSDVSRLRRKEMDSACPAPILRSSIELVGLRNISRLPYVAYPERNTATC